MEYPSNAFTVMDFDEEFIYDDEHIGKLICFDPDENTDNKDDIDGIDGSHQSLLSTSQRSILTTITGNDETSIYYYSSYMCTNQDVLKLPKDNIIGNDDNMHTNRATQPQRKQAAGIADYILK